MKKWYILSANLYWCFFVIGKQKFNQKEVINGLEYKKLIRDKGLKQNFIAQKIGISKTMMSLFLSGKRNLSPENKSKLHRILDINE